MDSLEASGLRDWVGGKEVLHGKGCADGILSLWKVLNEGGEVSPPHVEDVFMNWILRGQAPAFLRTAVGKPPELPKACPCVQRLLHPVPTRVT